MVVFPDPPALLSPWVFPGQPEAWPSATAVVQSENALRSFLLSCTILDICYVPLSCVHTSSLSDVIASPSAIQ